MRARFNSLTEATYGFNFDFWYTAGLWNDKYIPYSLVHNGKMVSNVSISKMEFLIENEKKRGIQIGTVMTDQAYRQRGLNKFIMERVLREWKDKTDFIYLFANNTVLDFYPKFNFVTVNEYQFSKSLNISNTPPSFRKLDIDDEHDRELLVSTINDSIPIAKCSMLNNTELILFYCLSFMKNSIYYLQDLKAVVLAETAGDTLHLNDVYSRERVDLGVIIKMMANKTINRVVLGFTPLDKSGFTMSLLKPDDVLFVYKDQAGYFKDRSWRFPVLSHA